MQFSCTFWAITLFSILSVNCCQGQQNPSETSLHVDAIAIIKGEGISGVIHLEQIRNKGPTSIHGKISGLEPGLHGFHIHEYGDFSDGCISTGPHFNPFGNTHGGPRDKTRHVGDLGSINASKNGEAEFSISDGLVKLKGPQSVIGRAFVVHADSDDLGKGQGEQMIESKKTGNAGKRIACGIIGYSKHG